MKQKPGGKLSRADRVKVLRRALAAYYLDPETTEWPSTKTAGFEHLNGLNYVLLYDSAESSTSPLACYLMRHDGKLKRLARLPEGS